MKHTYMTQKKSTFYTVIMKRTKTICNCFLLDLFFFQAGRRTSCQASAPKWLAGTFYNFFFVHIKRFLKASEPTKSPSRALQEGSPFRQHFEYLIQYKRGNKNRSITLFSQPISQASKPKLLGVTFDRGMTYRTLKQSAIKPRSYSEDYSMICKPK